MTDDLRSPEALDQAPAAFGLVERQQLGVVAVEPSPKPCVDLTHMVFGKPIELPSEIAAAVVIGKLHEARELVGRQSSVDPPNGLIPQKLHRVSIRLDLDSDLFGTAQRRSVRADEMFRIESGDVIQAAEQDARIAVFLAPDGKDIEEGRPDDVVHARSLLREPDGDRVVGVRRCGSELARESGDLDRHGVGDRPSRCHEARRERCVLRASELPPKPHIDQAVRPVGVEEHAELLDEASARRCTDLGGDPTAIADDPVMPPDVDVATDLVEHGLGTGDIVKVGVDHRRDRRCGDLAQRTERGGHLLVGLTRVDDDDALGSFDERLVGEAVADKAPHPIGDRPELRREPLGVLHQIPMAKLPLWPDDGERVIGRE